MKDLRQELKQALQEGRAYDFIANEGYQFSKDELIEIIKNYDFTLYQLAKQTHTIEETLKEYGSMVVENLDDVAFFGEDEEDFEELKDALKSRFNEVFKGNERLLAIQLDGFSHRLLYDFGDKTSQIMGESFSHYTSKQTHKLYKIFEGIEHSTYKHNAKELIYIQPSER